MDSGTVLYICSEMQIITSIQLIQIYSNEIIIPKENNRCKHRDSKNEDKIFPVTNEIGDGTHKGTPESKN